VAADAKRVETAFRIILSGIRIFNNIFGGSFVVIVLLGVVDAYKTWVMLLSANYCSLQGTNAAIAKE
jgi:F0F1-type ATP synthase membrane subunit a